MVRNPSNSKVVQKMGCLKNSFLKFFPIFRKSNDWPYTFHNSTRMVLKIEYGISVPHSQTCIPLQIARMTKITNTKKELAQKLPKNILSKTRKNFEHDTAANVLYRCCFLQSFSYDNIALVCVGIFRFMQKNHQKKTFFAKI